MDNSGVTYVCESCGPGTSQQKGASLACVLAGHFEKHGFAKVGRHASSGGKTCRMLESLEFKRKSLR